MRISGVDGRNGTSELGIVERSAGFAHVEGANVRTAEVCEKETCLFGLKRDVCRLIQDLACDVLDEKLDVLIR
jgi:hypothetical protein